MQNGASNRDGRRSDRRGAGGRGSGLWGAASLAAGLALVAGPARAEEPLWGEIASTLGQGFVNVTTGGSFRESKPFRHHGGVVALTIERTQFAANVEYGLRPDLDLYLRVPYFTQSYTDTFAGQSVTHRISGLRETEVGAKWRFRQWIHERTKDEISLIAGLKLPTGDNDLKDVSGVEILPSLQPNSGHLGATVGLAANRHTEMGGYWLSTAVTAENGSNRYQRGTMFELHASAGRRVRRLTHPDQMDWMGIVGLHLHRMGNDEEGGDMVEDSGGSTVAVELGVVGARRNRGFRLGILLPLRNDGGHAPLRREIQASYRASF